MPESFSCSIPLCLFLQTMWMPVPVRKEKAQTITGWSVSNHVIILANENTLIPIPASREIRKLPLIAFQNAPHFPVKNNFKLFPLMLFIESTNSS